MTEILISININGQPVTARSRMTILEAARENGYDIPTLCYLENLPPAGACPAILKTAGLSLKLWS